MYVAYSFCTILRKIILITSALREYYDEHIEMICTNGFRQCYYLILEGIIVVYKKQVRITIIKVNVQYSIYYIPLRKQEN